MAMSMTYRWKELIDMMIEFGEPVPFRLTRNLHMFFTPLELRACSYRLCVQLHKLQRSFRWRVQIGTGLLICLQHHIQNHLALFFRDELLSWYWRRPPMTNGSVGGLSTEDLKEKVTTNR